MSPAQMKRVIEDMHAGEVCIIYGMTETAAMVAALRPDDGPCRVFIERCTVFLRDGPPDGWNGTWRHDTK